MVSQFGHEALISIISQLVFMAVAFYALQALNFEKLIRANRVFQARLLYIVLTIALGTILSNFFLDYLLWSKQLQFLLQFVSFL
ncbi:DUF1146 family protein [Falsibacillus pallidus]|uniref:Putative integral membrane protein (TIGR02327 family) n=1 Tax=Falsibacillus pallidus TaxID=493781 RepID=A0A370GEH0_9BACI|nr:DUF1146 family protein [Falsibacillus pallidus]RDI41606.1 putative integral membrane protein (TIGR02327 family) [Falsibacillus pallidus]